MKPKNNIWIFMGNNSRFPSGAFIELDEAEAWIMKNKLSRMLSALPINEGFFDWAVANDAHSMKKETVLKNKMSQILLACLQRLP